MKRIISLVLVIMFMTLPSIVLAADLDLANMTVEELESLRLNINEELGARKRENSITQTDGSKTIRDLFPDVELAKYVRDEIGYVSIDQQVTQEQLDKVKSLNGNRKVSDLTGVGYLHNLKSIYNVTDIKVIPDELFTLTKLESLSLYKTKIEFVPVEICNLISLKYLDLSNTSISTLPEDIGNLYNLKELDISKTKITELPPSIYNLKLEKFKRDGLDIE